MFFLKKLSYGNCYRSSFSRIISDSWYDVSRDKLCYYCVA